MSLPFLRPEAVHRNADLLAAAVGIADRHTRSRAYRDALGAIQGWARQRESRADLALFFHGGGRAEEAFAHFLAGYDDLPSAKPFDADDVRAITAAVKESLDLLADLDSDARATFDLLVNTLLIVRIPAFGGLSDALGIVMAGPEAGWSRLEIAELLWHEAVHQALFLEELVNRLFTVAGEALLDDDARVTNPVLGAERPFDLAFHGAAVSVAIVDLHLRARSHRHARELLPELDAALGELIARRHLLAPRGAVILDELMAAAEALTSQLALVATPAMDYEGERPSRRSYLELQPAWRAGS